MKNKKDIYTIGHSNYSFDELISRISKYNINVIVDIRGIPYSKYNTQFNKEVLASKLKSLGYMYIYMAKEFAAKRTTNESYNEEGYADFERVKDEKIFKEGINRLKTGLEKGYNIVLLGAMQEPIRCHRAILLGKELDKLDFEIRHILHDETLATQSDIEELILEKYFPNRGQLTIDNLLGSCKSEKELIEDGYKLSNKEIGYRMEKL